MSDPARPLDRHSDSTDWVLEAPEGDCANCDGIAAHVGRCSFAADLYDAGFYAVSALVRRGDWDWTQALDHVQARATGIRNERGRAAAQEVLDQWEHMR